MSDPSYPAYPILAFLASVLVLVPLPWHLQAWNAGTCLYMIWTSISCFNLALNSVLWHDNVINFAPVWCDISSRIIVAMAVALPAASLCIMRRLYKIASVQIAGISHAEKRKAVIIDLLIGLGIPILQIIMQYVVSGHRFDIFEDFGCFPFTYNTPVAYPLSLTWPLVIGVITAIYCILTLREFFRRRVQFSEYLSLNAALTPNRYFRLMALATAELCCTVPVAAYGLWINLSLSQIEPWISWSDTHFNYSQVDQFPSILWRMDRHTVIGMEMTRAAPVVCAFVFFGFFGFADEAYRNYRKAYYAVARFCHIPSFSFKWLRSQRQRGALPIASDVAGVLPVFQPLPSTAKSSPSTSTYELKTGRSDSFMELPY